MSTHGFVPTMGALHEGHLALISRSLKENLKTTVSIFVNPTQFGPSEDFAKYPRTLEADIAACQKLGPVEMFIPTEKEIYPTEESKNYFPYQSDLFKWWEGQIRPTHFQGVVQVVDRLFQLVKPTHAYFGEKDFQQLTVIKAWVRDKNIPVKIMACPTLRELDGLAMSSRNRYLNPQERLEAASLYQVLLTAQKLFNEDVTDWNQMKDKALQKLSPLFHLDYFACVDSNDLKSQNRVLPKSRLIIAAKIGQENKNIRLIDNIGLTHEQS